MNFSLRCLSAAFFIAACGSSLSAQGQRACGLGLLYEGMAKENPAQYQALRDRMAEEAAIIEAQQGTGAKTAATGTIPVVFHFLLTTSQYNTLGGDDGIRKRVISQLKALNADYNRGNADSTKIPAAFKSRYANVGIRFGLAGATSSNTISSGIEVKQVASGTIYNVDDNCDKAKHNTSTGLAAWDNRKYLNIWVCKITNSTGNATILGVATPPYIIGQSYGGHMFDSSEKGVVINNGAFGVMEDISQGGFFTENKLGRTLTHEVGHYFELIHIWGDDDNSDTVTKCSINSGGTDDDLVGDTPPQGKRNYCDFPNHAGTSCPSFPLLDKCSPTSPGIMFMNYMDYVNDDAMMMFTTGQATRMNYYLGAENPDFGTNPALVGVNDVNAPVGEVSVYPNPASGNVHLSLERADGFRGAEVVNMMGQTVSTVAVKAGAKQYDIDLSAAPRGIYLVQVHYDGGTTTQKLVLE